MHTFAKLSEAAGRGGCLFCTVSHLKLVWNGKTLHARQPSKVQTGHLNEHAPFLKKVFSQLGFGHTLLSVYYEGIGYC